MQAADNSLGVDRAVFVPAIVLAVGFVLWGSVAPASLAAVAGAVLGAIIEWFGWSFVVSTAGFLGFAVFLACRFAVMGGAALHSELTGPGGIVDAINGPGGAAVSLFTLLAQYPAAALTSFVAVFLVAIFFISGADAGAVVMGMLSSRGIMAPQPRVVVLWGVLAGASAAVLLVMGGLKALQTASIIAAAPFLLVMVGLCVSLWRSLLDELEGRREVSPSLAPAGEAPSLGLAAQAT